MLHLVDGNEDAPETGYNRSDVLRIVQISGHQLGGWERARLILPRKLYSFIDIALLKTLRDLRAQGVSIAKIKASIEAMQDIESMIDPLQETTVVRTGTGIAFRYNGAIVDPVRRQFVFDFERMEPALQHAISIDQSSGWIAKQTRCESAAEKFSFAIKEDEAGKRDHAAQLYREIIHDDPSFAAAYINLGTNHFHAKAYKDAERAFRKAIEVDPSYALGFFNLATVLDELKQPDEAIQMYRRALEICPRYADAHYNLAFAYQSAGEMRAALRHWREYTRLDHQGQWSENAKKQIHNLLTDEFLSIAWRSDESPARKATRTPLQLV